MELQEFRHLSTANLESLSRIEEINCPAFFNYDTGKRPRKRRRKAKRVTMEYLRNADFPIPAPKVT